MSENWFLWYKNVRCSIFSSPWIMDAMVCFIFTFVCWTTVEYYPEVRNANKWMSGIHHDVSNKKLLTFSKSSTYWNIQIIEHNQVSKHFRIINSYSLSISLIFIALFLSSSMYRNKQYMSSHFYFIIHIFLYTCLVYDGKLR